MCGTVSEFNFHSKTHTIRYFQKSVPLNGLIWGRTDCCFLDWMMWDSGRLLNEERGERVCHTEAEGLLQACESQGLQAGDGEWVSECGADVERSLGRVGCRQGGRKWSLGRGKAEEWMRLTRVLQRSRTKRAVRVWREGGMESERERFQGGWFMLLRRLARPKSAGRAGGLETQESPGGSQAQRPTAGRVPHGCGCVLPVWNLSPLGSCAEIGG